MRALWIAAPIVALFGYFAFKRAAQDSQVQAFFGGLAEAFSDDAAGVTGSEPADSTAVAEPTFVQSIELAGAGIVTGIERAAAEVSSTVRKLFSVPPAGRQYADAIARAETAHGIPESLLARVIYQESRFRPEIINGTKRSAAGAIGIAQFMPDTAAELRVNPLDPWQSIDGAARYLKRLYASTGDWVAAVAAYNWGIGNVRRKGLAAAPAETRDYIAEVFHDVTV